MIVGCLAWYDEPVALLDRAVRSLNGVVDCLVAVDGRWDLMPGDGDVSPDEQSHAIFAAASMPCMVARDRGFASQAEKRDEMMQIAAGHGDWLLVIDADEAVAEADAAILRAMLSITRRDAADVALTHLNAAWPYSAMQPNTVTARRLYRAGTRVRDSHDGYRLDGQWLSGHPDKIDALDLTTALRIEHDNNNRGPVRNKAARIYRQSRTRDRVESWR